MKHSCERRTASVHIHCPSTRTFASRPFYRNPTAVNAVAGQAQIRCSFASLVRPVRKKCGVQAYLGTAIMSIHCSGLIGNGGIDVFCF